MCVCTCVFRVHGSYTWAHGTCICTAVCVPCVSCCELCYTCCVGPFCVCVSPTEVCCVCTCCVCAHGVCVGVNMLTPLCQVRTRSHPILDYLPKVQSPYCILVSDIIFSLFLFCSSLVTFLRISTEMWQRINLFIQRALSLCLLLAHFSLLILKWNYALRLNNAPPQIQLTWLKEVRKDGDIVYFSPEISSPTLMGSKRRDGSGHPQGSGGRWFLKYPFRSIRKGISTLGSVLESKGQVLVPGL